LGDAPFVLAVGSLTLDKRYDYLIEVWSRLPRPGIRLVVCGEGAHGAQLRERAGQLGLEIQFVGHLDADSLRGAYSAATCFVHAGAVETFGLSVLEAMSCGLPVLAVDGGAVPEVLGDAGLLVPADGSSAFHEALCRLLGDSSLRAALGAAARRRVLAHFSLEEMHRQYVAALQGVCAPCGSPS
jgi:glycosyltransferase involved in cell wall biosynthesis